MQPLLTPEQMQKMSQSGLAGPASSVQQGIGNQDLIKMMMMQSMMKGPGKEAGPEEYAQKLMMMLGTPYGKEMMGAQNGKLFPKAPWNKRQQMPMPSEPLQGGLIDPNTGQVQPGGAGEGSSDGGGTGLPGLDLLTGVGLTGPLPGLLGKLTGINGGGDGGGMSGIIQKLLGSGLLGGK